MRNHPHPGELLKEDVLESLELSVTEASARLGMSRVINGKVGISPDLAVRLERAGVSTVRFWMTLQTNYELEQANRREQPPIEPWTSAAAVTNDRHGTH